MPLNKITILESCQGLNNKISPSRIPYNADGSNFLAVANNVVVGETGRVSTRPGYEKVIDLTNAHSLFSNNFISLVAADTTLYSINADLAVSALRTDLQANAQFDYTTVANFTFYTNGFQNGVFRDQTHQAWVASTSHSRAKTRTLVTPLVGELLEYYNGRVYIAKDDIVYYTDPFNYFAVDLAQGFYAFGGKITLLQAVSQGLFVGTTEGTHFIQSPGTTSVQSNKVSPSIPVKFTSKPVDGEYVGEKFSGLCALWLSDKGIQLGASNGSIYNLTKNVLDLPKTAKGTAFFHKGFYYTLTE